MNTVGFLISHKNNEKRRALMPQELDEIKNLDHLVFETGYGESLGFSDEDYKAKNVKFLPREGKLLPPFVAISGLGENAARDIAEGRRGKKFISVEEFSAACPKVSQTHIDTLYAAGAFGNMPRTSQTSLFD